MARDVDSRAEAEGDGLELGLLRQLVVGVVVVGWGIVAGGAVRLLDSGLEAEFEGLAADVHLALVVCARPWRFHHRCRVSVVRDVDLLVVGVRDSEALALVRANLVELALDFVGVGRGRVHSLSHHQPVFLAEAELGEAVLVDGRGQKLHFRVVVHFNLKEGLGVERGRGSQFGQLM